MSDDKLQDARRDVATRHAETAKNFSRLVDATPDWDAPTPVEGWTAREVVRHLVEWSRDVVGSAPGITFAEVPSVDQDPAAAWHKHTEQVQALLDDPRLVEQAIDNPHFGNKPVVEALDEFYLPDVFMHAWDLGQATGQSSGLDQAACAQMLEGMEKHEQMLRTSGQFGERQPVRDDASSEQRLMAFIGRDPEWTRPELGG